jgi:hypothetical protein
VLFREGRTDLSVRLNGLRRVALRGADGVGEPNLDGRCVRCLRHDGATCETAGNSHSGAQRSTRCAMFLFHEGYSL